MKVDYIIVGFGLAGLAFAEQLERNKKSYIVFENNSQQSSRVAGGLYNPVILKRFTAAWKAKDQLGEALIHYKEIEKRIQSKIIWELPILRIFNSVEEQNLWFEASDKPILNEFLSPKLRKFDNVAIRAPFHYGEVIGTGRVDIGKALAGYLEMLERSNRLINNSFDANNLQVKDGEVTYQDIISKHVVFTEGFGIKQNPFFNSLPLIGNKGEYLIIKSPELKLSVAIKSSIFIIPLGDDLYKIGATYNNRDKSPEVSKDAKNEILRKLEVFLKAEYEIVDQVAGIRPTTKDRRPLVGTHGVLKNVHVLNGLGSRGILIAPWAARLLYRSIENKTPLTPEIDINRFHYS